MTTATAATTAVRTFVIDKAHSEVGFQVRHLITKVRGRFTDFTGTIQFDPQQPHRASVSLTVQASSIDTAQPDRDTHLRSDDFFAVDRFPTIAFTSTRVVPKSASEFDVVGALTIRGVAKEVTVPVSFLGFTKDPWGNERAGFEADVTIDRREWGLVYNGVLETGGFMLGDDVKISFQVQAVAAD